VVAGHAQGGFTGISGLDRRALLQNKVTVALTSVKSFTVSWRTSYARSGHLELRLEEPLFGPKPAEAWLKRVPYTSGAGYSSAWPDLGDHPEGAFLLMAWHKGHACGEGSAVHLGERFSLPMTVSGPGDPRVAAVRELLRLISITDVAARSMRLQHTFSDSSNPYLVIFADAALVALDPLHRTSAVRYVRLLGILNGAPGADEELGWPLLQELTRNPGPRDPRAYADWKKDCRGPAPDGSWPSFLQFRRMVQTRLRAFAANPRADVDLRRWAVAALAAAPSFVGKRKDRLDGQAVAAILERLRDPVVEVRRAAARALLSAAAALQPADRPASRRLRAQVRQMLRKETDSEEKANLQMRIDEIAGTSPRDEER
jgi:hypothetical protein